jgi:hypothetical protein
MVLQMGWYWISCAPVVGMNGHIVNERVVSWSGWRRVARVPRRYAQEIGPSSRPRRLVEYVHSVFPVVEQVDHSLVHTIFEDDQAAAVVVLVVADVGRESVRCVAFVSRMGCCEFKWYCSHVIARTNHEALLEYDYYIFLLWYECGIDSSPE